MAGVNTPFPQPMFARNLIYLTETYVLLAPTQILANTAIRLRRTSGYAQLMRIGICKLRMRIGNGKLMRSGKRRVKLRRIGIGNVKVQPLYLGRLHMDAIETFGAFLCSQR